LRQFELVEPARDQVILAKLGGENLAKLTLGQFWEFLKLGLADERFWYIAYIEDREGMVWAISAHWDADGIRIGATTTEDPDEWVTVPTRRFLSR
jgi:hypothetical protein